MRKLIPALATEIAVVLWEALLHFGTVQTALAALRLQGGAGGLVANFLSSQYVILAFALAGIGLAIRGMYMEKKRERPGVQTEQKQVARSVTQTMTSSPNASQAGRDIKTSREKK